MASPAHRANILDADYTQIGIGIVVSGGRVWVTQVFRQPRMVTSATTTRTVTTTRKAPTTTSSRRPAARSSAPAPRAVAKASAKAVPTAAELLARRITAAGRQAGAGRGADPLAAAIGWSDAMRTVSG